MRKYKIIYADPPWTFKTFSQKGKGKSAERHYACMGIEDIYSLPVHTLADQDCVLFLWVTWPLLEQGLETIRRWGFRYKTCGFNWVKRNRKSDGFFWGTGYWTRANSEVCLIATKGKPKRLSAAVHQVCDARIARHSEKPFEIRDRIVQLMGDLPRVELFARTAADGWDVFGNQIENSISL